MVVDGEIQKIIDRLEKKDNNEGIRAVHETVIYYQSKMIKNNDVLISSNNMDEVKSSTQSFPVKKDSSLEIPKLSSEGVNPLGEEELKDLDSGEEELSAKLDKKAKELYG